MKRILVVEDDERLREVLSLLLSEAGYQVSSAENGREGVAQLGGFNPDLVLTDVAMPDMEGIEFLRILRKTKAELPVIVMSGNVTGARFLRSARVFGAAATLKKPFSNGELLGAIENLL
ncbi:MAG: response regulator [Spirochaetaceae bacterium]|nr:response regulator [Spirochaetaceae bacterium]